MSWFIQQVFIVLLSSGESLATKCVSLNKVPCMIRPPLIDLNPIELKYYPLMISIDKFSKSSTVADDLSTKISVPSIMKQVNMSVKIIVREKKIIAGILAHVFVKMVSIKYY